MNFRSLDWILLALIAYLLYDKFKRPSKSVATLNGASVNTAPSLIDNSGIGDTFDLEVEVLTKQLGY